MNEYKIILDKIANYEKQLEDTSLSDMDRKLIEIEIGDLTDQAKRMTFNISCMEEDNLV